MEGAPPRDGARSHHRAERTAGRSPVTAGNVNVGATLAGQVLDRTYEIIQRITQGAMSHVYAAREISSGRPVALKVLSRTLIGDRMSFERLRREAGLVMRLKHPNICPLLRWGETEDGLIYLVMPFLHGETLFYRQARGGPMAHADCIPILVQVCHGLQHAHNFRIIHRDLKPENVFLVKNADGSERAVIMDFGLAKEQRDYAELRRLTKTGTIIGTAEFISPEQIRREPVDGRTDVYSLAIMAFELVSGDLPFPASSPNETLMAHLTGEPAPLRSFRPDLPASLEQVLAKGMALAPDDRHDTALDFAHALRGTLTAG